MALSVVIMAGGSGERFWPYSRKDRPKQFLPIIGNRSPLQETVARALRLTDPEHIYVVTGKQHRALVTEQIPELPTSNVLYEPEGRDTAPCIALAAAWINASDPGATMVVLPADQLVKEKDAFSETLKRAVKTAQSTGGLVTIGIPPTRPETGYGYIRMARGMRASIGDSVADRGSIGGEGAGLVGARRVLAFKEKPDAETAATYLASGDYVWNGGMFVWNVSAIRIAISEHLPDLADGLGPIEAAIGTPAFEGRLEEHFPTLPKVSIDYGVMEKANDVWVVPAQFDWDDLGSWTALDRTLPADAEGNRIDAQALPLETKRSILASSAGSQRLIVAFGLEDALVVDTPDVVLVTPKRYAPDLKRVLAELKARGLERYQDGVVASAAKAAGEERLAASLVKAEESSGPVYDRDAIDGKGSAESDAPQVGPVIAHSSSGIRVRKSVSEDARALMAIDNAVWDARKSPSVIHWDDVEAFHDQFPPGSLYVAEVNGAVAGYVELHPATPLRSNRHVGELAMAVDSVYRRRGVGSRLLQAAEEEAKARGLRKLSLRVLATNDQAIAFYKANGFREQGRLPEEFLLDGAYVDDIFMYKMLTDVTSSS